jgi:hypothetical protein
MDNNNIKLRHKIIIKFISNELGGMVKLLDYLISELKKRGYGEISKRSLEYDVEYLRKTYNIRMKNKSYYFVSEEEKEEALSAYGILADSEKEIVKQLMEMIRINSPKSFSSNINTVLQNNFLLD